MGRLGLGDGVMSGAKSDTGFTIVEVVVALSLMFVVLMSAAPMFIFAMKENASAGDLGMVGAAAVDRTELLRAVDFNLLLAGGSITSNVTGYFDVSDPEVTVRWQVTNNANPVTEKTIQVRAIRTRQAMGRAKNITLVTLRVR